MINNRWKQIATNEKFRFLVTGAFNTVIGFLVFSAIQFTLGKYITYFGSLYVSHFLTSTVAFFIYRKYVFVVKGQLFKDYWRFQTVYIVPLLANTFLLPAIVMSTHVNVYIAQGIATIVLTIVSYLGHKYFSFQRSNPINSAESSANEPD